MVKKIVLPFLTAFLAAMALCLGSPGLAQAQATTYYIGSGTQDVVWTNAAADHSAPPDDANGNAWNSSNYDFTTAPGPIPWRTAAIVNPLDPGWGAACNFPGSGLISHWISTQANSGSGTSTDNGYYYYLRNFSIPVGYAVTRATLNCSVHKISSGFSVSSLRGFPPRVLLIS
jgi:hypothetical protein